jgi:hypothetical protein
MDQPPEPISPHDPLSRPDDLWVPESRPSAPSCGFAEEALTQMIGGWRYDCSI